MAIAGIAFKIFFTGRFKLLSTLLYLAMGWIVMIAFKPALQGLGRAGFIWLGAGGICYSVGCVFYMNKKMPYAHAIWHMFVLAGTITHFFGILFHVVLR